MSYYKLLKLNKEPFSTSPDPAFLYRSESHNSALNRLEISIRLRRGLSLILGDIGTGKTTLCRALLQNFKSEDNFIFHIMLDPNYKTDFQFITHLTKLFRLELKFRSTANYKVAMERYLYQKGVEENKTIVLVIDEGQNLTPQLIEVLRVLLNYEINEYKLLQLVIMAQMELLPKITKIKNFLDRIGFNFILHPLNETETKNMINYRLAQAGYTRAQDIFTDDAVLRIYSHTKGYPRKIITLCHNALVSMVMAGKSVIDAQLVEKIIDENKIISFKEAAPPVRAHPEEKLFSSSSVSDLV